MEIYVKAGSKTMIIRLAICLSIALTGCYKTPTIKVDDQFPKYQIDGSYRNGKPLKLTVQKFFTIARLPDAKTISWYDNPGFFTRGISDDIKNPVIVSINATDGTIYDTCIWLDTTNTFDYIYSFSAGPLGKFGTGYQINLTIEDKQLSYYINIPPKVEIDTAMVVEEMDSNLDKLVLLPYLPLPDSKDTLYFINGLNEVVFWLNQPPIDTRFEPPQSNYTVANKGFIDLCLAKELEFIIWGKDYSDAQIVAETKKQLANRTFLDYYPAHHYRYAMKRNQITQYNNSGPVAGPLPYPHMAGQDQDVYGYIVGYGRTYVKFDL
jgi:hypothetical protein